MVAELAYGASKFPNFRILAYFPHTKRLKRTFQSTAQVLHHRMLPIPPCGSQRSKGVPSGSRVFLRLLVGELGTPKVAQIFTYGKWLYPYRMLLEKYDALMKTVHKLYDKNFPLISHTLHVRNIHRPWITKAIRNSIKKKVLFTKNFLKVILRQHSINIKFTEISLQPCFVKLKNAIMLLN